MYFGNNVGMGKDYILYAFIDGVVKFEYKDRNCKKVFVVS